jgi:hypothetical protein
MTHTEADTDVEPELFDSLEGQVALVTGANRGIGAAIAAGLVEHGATVYAGVRAPERFDEPAGQTTVRLDVTDAAHDRAAVERLREEVGRLDVLVNNAGVMDSRGPLDGMDDGTVTETLDVNLRGPMLLTKYALPLLRAAEPGRVVNLSSGMGQLSRMSGGSPAYRVSKAAINALSAYLDAEYREEGLIANAVSPGWVNTGMGGPEAPRSPEEGADTPVWLARFREGPSGRLWKDREVIEW